MHEIFLSGLDHSQDGFQTAAIRGIRQVFVRLGIDNSFRAAKAIVDDFIEHPTVMRKVGEHEDYLTVKGAMNFAENYHQGAATFSIDPDDLELPHPVQPDEDDEPEGECEPLSTAAYKTALVILATVEGNPMMAYARAYQLGRASDDQGLYQEVQAALLDVFELKFHTAGPDIHIVGEGS